MSFTLAGLCHPPGTLHAAAARQFTNGLFVRVPSHQLYAHAGSNTWSGEGIRTYRFSPSTPALVPLLPRTVTKSHYAALLPRRPRSSSPCGSAWI